MSERKILSREAAAEKARAAKASGKKVGYTSGVFDLLHPGHIEYLEKAKSLVDILIVGLNSDSSVRSNKGELRPVFDQEYRSRVLAGLGSVDYLFIFDELNNNTNVDLLRPDIYVKAGDYSESTLSSKPLVENYGGRIELITFTPGYSSTTSFSRVLEKHGLGSTVDQITYERKPALFLDRDGTLIREHEYLSDPKLVEPVPGIFEALKKCKENGYRLIIVTNQPGIGLGYYTHEDFYKVNKALLSFASKAQVLFDKIYYCPHSQSDKCSCRKPGTGMIDRAVKEMNIDVSKSFVIGDMTGDLQLAKNAGMKSVLVKTGKAGTDGIFRVKADFTIESLADIQRVLEG